MLPSAGIYSCINIFNQLVNSCSEEFTLNVFYAPLFDFDSYMTIALKISIVMVTVLLRIIEK